MTTSSPAPACSCHRWGRRAAPRARPSRRGRGSSASTTCRRCTPCPARRRRRRPAWRASQPAPRSASRRSRCTSTRSRRTSPRHRPCRAPSRARPQVVGVLLDAGRSSGRSSTPWRASSPPGPRRHRCRRRPARQAAGRCTPSSPTRLAEVAAGTAKSATASAVSTTSAPKDLIRIRWISPLLAFVSASSPPAAPTAPGSVLTPSPDRNSRPLGEAGVPSREAGRRPTFTDV